MSVELPTGWELSSKVLPVPLEQYLIDFPKLEADLAKLSNIAAEPVIATNIVRKARAASVYPDKPYFTGFEGHFFAHLTLEQALEVERWYGQKLETTIARLKPPLRQEVIAALEGTSYSLAAIAWLDAELGAILARFRAVGIGVVCQSEKHIQDRNRHFREGTYDLIKGLPEVRRQVVQRPRDSGTLVEVPVPLELRRSTPGTTAERYMSEIGKFCLPIFRTLAPHGPYQPYHS